MLEVYLFFQPPKFWNQQRQLAILTRKSILLVDCGDFTTLGSFENESEDLYTAVYFISPGRLLLCTDKGVLSLFTVEHILRDAQPGQLKQINSLRLEPGALLTRDLGDEIFVILQDPKVVYRFQLKLLFKNAGCYTCHDTFTQ